jgi:hypothetical protein
MGSVCMGINAMLFVTYNLCTEYFHKGTLCSTAPIIARMDARWLHLITCINCKYILLRRKYLCH